MRAAEQIINFLGKARASTPDPAPIAGLTKTFDYIPSRDGLALLTGGPYIAGYIANKVASPSRIWMPRFDDVSINTKGSSDTFSGNYSWQADPEYAWSNGYTPFFINGSGNLVIRAQTSVSVAPAFAGGELPINSVTTLAYNWVSGILSSQASFAQSGGYFELTAKLPNSKGSWPAFWMYAPLGTSQKIIHPPEIDIIEYLGGLDANTTYRVNAISNGPVQHSQSIVAGANLSAGFHKYGVYYDDSAITFYLDGVAVGTPQSITSLPEFIQPMFFLLSNQVGSTLGGWVPAPDGSTITPLDMEISAVKAWQRTGPVAIELSHLAYLDSFTVGQTVATISVTNFGASSGNVITITADPDSMFAISGTNLNLAQAVPEATKATHDVTLRVTDGGGKTLTRKFTMRAVAASPAGVNLVTDPNDVTLWSATNVTTPAADTVLETVTSGQHAIVKANLTRAAGIKQYRAYFDIEPINSRYFHLLQFFDGNFGGTGGAISYVSLETNRLIFQNIVGAWTNISAWNPARIPGSTKVRIGFDITTDATSVNFTMFPQLLLDMFRNSYPGDVTKGFKASNFTFLDANWTPASLGSNLKGWIEPAKGGMFQSIVGSGTPATANGNPVGYIPDQSGNGFHLTGAADDATRMTLSGVGTKPKLTMTSTQLLQRAASFGGYANGSAFCFVAIKGICSSTNWLIGEVNGGTNISRYQIVNPGNPTAANLGSFIRNEANTTLFNNTTNLQTGVFSSSVACVAGIIDSGSTMTGYNNGVAGSPSAYSRSGTVTLTKFQINQANWAADLAGAIWGFGVPSAGDISNIQAYLSNLN